MRKHLIRFGMAALCMLPAAFAQADLTNCCDFFESDDVAIDGLAEFPRFYNDFPSSTLTITNNFPSDATIDDRNLPPGGFANRHDLRFSSDSGATAHTFDIDDGWTVQAFMKLEAGANSPRKEMGLRVGSDVTGDALFIINSNGGDAGSGTGEIVAFGGPFYSFSGGIQDNYTVGTEILMGMTYSGDSSSPRTIEYFIDRDCFTPGGIESSGPLVWDNLENGPVDYYVAMYAQVSATAADDFITATFTNCSTCIPEPSTLMLSALAVIGLAGMARRSKD